MAKKSDRTTSGEIEGGFEIPGRGAVDGPLFTMQRAGEKKAHAYTLAAMREANRDDPEVLEWLDREPPVGGGLITGGGAAPVCSVRRIK